MPNNKIEELRQKVRAIETSTVSSPVNTEATEDYFSGSVDFDSQECKDDINKRIRWSAMELLARREHSGKELTNKLLKRYPDNIQVIFDCVTGLSEDNLQSDERFCAAYVAMRKRKGYGPQRIAAELRERGVNDVLSKAQLRDPEHDWFAVAANVWERKFRGLQPLDVKEKARQMRFLNYRGFYSEHIQQIVNQFE